MRLKFLVQHKVLDSIKGLIGDNFIIKELIVNKNATSELHLYQKVKVITKVITRMPRQKVRLELNRPAISLVIRLKRLPLRSFNVMSDRPWIAFTLSLSFLRTQFLVVCHAPVLFAPTLSFLP
jgi:hypothetical protein